MKSIKNMARSLDRAQELVQARIASQSVEQTPDAPTPPTQVRPGGAMSLSKLRDSIARTEAAMLQARAAAAIEDTVVGKGDTGVGQEDTAVGQSDTVVGKEETVVGQSDTVVGKEDAAVMQDDTVPSPNIGLWLAISAGVVLILGIGVYGLVSK